MDATSDLVIFKLNEMKISNIKITVLDKVTRFSLFEKSIICLIQ